MADDSADRTDAAALGAAVVAVAMTVFGDPSVFALDRSGSAAQGPPSG